jgi:hypothetical protein
MELFDILLAIHVFAGFLALCAALAAVITKTFDMPHFWHKFFGTIYFFAMLVIFLSAIPMALIHRGEFLFLIAIFSFYLAYSGWRAAKNRQGIPHRSDWAAVLIMGLCSIVMLGYGVFLLLANSGYGFVIIVFGSIAGALVYSGWKILRGGGLKGRARIARHVGLMLGGTIATTTAFVVTNFEVEPAWLLWLGPTIVITPVITWWTRKIERGDRIIGLQ